MENNNQGGGGEITPVENIELGEQSPEEISRIITEAKVSGRDVKITQTLSDGFEKKQIISVISIGEGVVTIKPDEDGATSIELVKIKRVKILDQGQGKPG